MEPKTTEDIIAHVREWAIDKIDEAELCGEKIALYEEFGEWIEGPQAGVIMIMSMMPVAVLNYIFTVQNDKDSNTVGGLVMISTTIMLVVLPFFMNTILNYY